jgi:hypothetical protein
VSLSRTSSVLARTDLLLVGFCHVGDMDQAPLAAGQNNGHTLMPKASGCYGARHRRSPGSVTKHINVPSAALVRSTAIAIQRETACSRLSGRDAQVK